MAVRRRDVDRQRDAVFLNGHLDLDAADLLATVDAARKTARRRAAAAAVDDHGARFRGIPAGEAPGAAKPIEQPTPEAEPGPASEQSIERVEGDVAELSDRSPLHTRKNRHTRSPSPPCAAPLRPAAAWVPSASAGCRPLPWP